MHLGSVAFKAVKVLDGTFESVVHLSVSVDVALIFESA